MYRRRNILETGYQDHHQPKIREQCSRSCLGSFVNSNGIIGFLGSFLDYGGINLRDKPPLLICLTANIPVFK